MDQTTVIAVTTAAVTTIAAAAAAWQARSAQAQLRSADRQAEAAEARAAAQDEALARRRRAEELERLRTATSSVNSALRDVIARYYDMTRVYENALTLLNLFNAMPMMRDARSALDAAINEFVSTVTRVGHLWAGPAYADGLATAFGLLDKLNTATHDDAFVSPMNAFASHRTKATQKMRGLLRELAATVTTLEGVAASWTPDDFPEDAESVDFPQ